VITLILTKVPAQGGSEHLEYGFEFMFLHIH
jgi:hypothetical protein